MKRRIVSDRVAFTVFSVLLILACVGLLFHSLFAQRYTQSAATVIETGKMQLFDKTIPGALAAYQTFQGAFANDYASAEPADKIKIRVYLAFTRILDTLLRNDGGGVDTLTELLAQYGITRKGDAFEGLKFNLPLNDDKKVILPATAPVSAENLRAFFTGPFLTALNASIADMDAAIALCENGTAGVDLEIIAKDLIDPDDSTRPNVEVDAGDYHLFRSILKFLKVYALMSAGYNAEIDIREIIALVNLEMGPEGIKRLLDRYQDFLKIRTGGAANLNEARLNLIEAITDYETASDKIRNDHSTTAGAEELISIENADLGKEAFYRGQMAKVRDSLQNNRAVALGGSTETWNFTAFSTDFHATFDDGFSEGRYTASGGFGNRANLDYAIVNGLDVTLHFTFNPPENGWSVFQGTFNSDKTQIPWGTINGRSDTNGNFGGNFSAVRTSIETHTQNVNLFPLFGDGSTVAPKALRDLMPQLNEFGYPVPGTMGSGLPAGEASMLGGIMPDFATQEQWIREMDEIFTPFGPLTIHQLASDGAIAINGNSDDWAGIAPVLTDLTGEKGSLMAANGDLEKVFLARDNYYLYVRMDLAGDWNLSGQTFMYGLRFRQNPGDGPDKTGDSKIYVRFRNGVWEMKMQSWYIWQNYGQTYGYYQSPIDLIAQGGIAAATGKVVEWRVPLASLGTIAGRFLSADTDAWYYDSYGWDYWDSYDRNPTCLQIQPAASVTGTLSVPGYDGGPVYVRVYEYGPDFSTDPTKRLGSQIIFPDGSGHLPATYAVNNLPVGRKVFVTVHWDPDGDGVVTPGDYTNFYLPFTTAARGNTLNLTAGDDHSAYLPPRFHLAVVYHEKQPPPPTGTGNWNVVIAAQLTGPSPDDVTITVTGPGGNVYTLTPGAVINKRGLVYRTSAYSLPNGDYTFTAVDSLGRKTESTYHYEEQYDLPGIASLSPANNSYVGSVTPTLSWTKPADGYAYQVWVVDYNYSSTGATWYVSDMTTDASLTIPAGVLLPDTPYYWFVRLYDRANNPMNYTMSPVYAFYTGAYAAAPVFSSVAMSTRPPTGTNPNYSNSVDAKVQGLAPWDVTGWQLKKGTNVVASGTSAPYFEVRANDSFFTVSFSTATPTAPPSNGSDYSFVMNVNRSGSVITKNWISYIYKSVQSVDVTSMAPSGNYYFQTSMPTFSWNPVSDPDTSYRLRIFDPLGKIILWGSAWSADTQVTVPAGILKPGGTYYWTVQTAPAINPSYVQAYVNTESNSANKTLYRFTLQTALPGDVSGNGVVDLEDAILALRVVSGSTASVAQTGDVDGDNRIGLPEAIYILQTVSGLR